MKNRYWLLQWLDERGINDAATARDALSNDKLLEQLFYACDHAAEHGDIPDDTSRGVSILAGRSSDLSADLTCPNPECRRREVDSLIKKTALYFDRVIVDDAVTRHLVDRYGQWRDSQDFEILIGHIDIVFYIRDIGAEELVEFRAKPPPHEQYWRLHARGAGIDAARIAELEERLSATLQAFEARDSLTGRPAVSLRHPLFGHIAQLAFDVPPRARLSTKAFRRTHASNLMALYVSRLASDIEAARAWSAPLGSVIPLHRELLRVRKPTNPSEIPFHLQLPVLDRVPVRVLIDIRRGDHGLFDRFRGRLELAVREQLKDDASERPEDVARSIQEDILEPELRDIGKALTAAEESLRKRAALTAGVTAFMTTFALMPFVPLEMGLSLIATTLAKSVVDDMKAYEQRRSEIGLKDTYFLWRAARSVRRH